MRAAVLHNYGEVPVVEDVPEPSPGEGVEVLDVVCAGLNPVDRSIASGSFYAGAPPLPYTVGSEGIARRDDGILAYFNATMPPFGSMAQRAAVIASTLVELPAGVDPQQAVAFGIAGLAGWLALESRAQLQAGETVLVLGASGVVGTVAVQAAKLLGAGRVVAAARSEAGLERARALGADATVRLGSVDDGAALRDALGEGADVVVDPLWGPAAEAALTALRPGARFVQLGQSAGAEATIASGLVRGRAVSILGHTNVLVAQDVRTAAYLRMLRHAAAGELTVEVDAVALEDLSAAWERQGESPGRKLVVVP